MIRENVKKILADIPENVKVAASTKTRTVCEIEQAIDAGITILGENYVKEAQDKFDYIGRRVSWHLLGHLQKNKVKQAVKIFDLIETLDSLALAETIDKECGKINKVMPVLIELNSAKECSKTGIVPEDLNSFIEKLLSFSNLKLSGLMTMGPLVERPQDIRPYFKQTKEIFDIIRSKYVERLQFNHLSMGMSDTYRIAIEEGTTLVRIGTAIFGERP
ncbi:MAG: YggS family pyridoxal phosphate-dependent enzyme [Candidatus Omnitrophota bacterium]